jgi:DNA-binding CsgD family transcriptional regulator
MGRLGLILVLLFMGFFAIFSGDLRLGGAKVPTWFILEGLSARVFGALMVVIAGWLIYREFRGNRRPRIERAQATPGESRDVQPSPAQRPLELTEDDRRFLGLLAEDLPDEQIADRLGMPGLDINMMTLHLCGKLGVKSKAELIQQAREIGLLVPDAKGRIPSPEQPA